MKSARLSTNKKCVVLLITSLSLVVGLLAIRLTTPIAQNSSTSSLASATKVTAEKARDAYGKIELSFEANRGQTDSSVNFLARGVGYTLFLKPTEAVFRLRNTDSGLRNDSEHTAISNQQSAIEESAISNRRVGQPQGWLKAKTTLCSSAFG